MPASQRGTLAKRGDRWSARWRDENGQLRRRTFGLGRDGKADAQAFLDRTLRDVEALRNGDPITVRRENVPTLRVLADEYLPQHAAAVDPDTIEKLRWQLRHAVEAFGDVKADRLTPRTIAGWRAKLPAGSARDIHQALRQLYAHAARLQIVEANPAKAVPNPAPRRAEVQTFGSWAEVEAIAEEIGPWAPLVVVAAGTGLRPEEWVALEWVDISRNDRVLTVRRTYTRGRLKETTKTDRSRRRVPLRRRVLDALDAIPRRIDTRLVFPGLRGGHLNHPNWRRRDWKPALRAAGADDFPPYALRHFYAASSLAAGVSLYSLARRMGTSVKMIDQVYGHLVAEAEAYELDLLNVYDARQPALIHARQASAEPS